MKMTFSLINMMTEEDGKVSGYWLQDHIGTLETARDVVRKTEEANSNEIDVAVVEAVNSPVAMLDYWQDLTRIDR